MKYYVLLLFAFLISISAYSQKTFSNFFQEEIEMEEKMEIRIAEDKIIIENAVGKVVMVYNMIGNVVAEMRISQPDDTLDISKLAHGVYFCKVDNIVKKFIK